MLLHDQSLHTFIGGISTRSNLTNGKTNTKVRKNQTIDVSSKGNLEQRNDGLILMNNIKYIIIRNFNNSEKRQLLLDLIMETTEKSDSH